MDGLAELIRSSERVGRDRLLAPGVSGNTSVKIDDVMWVKISGKSLRNSICERTFVPVSIDQAREAFREGKEDSFRARYGTDIRPSCEMFSHLFIRRKAVIHVHEVNTVAWTIQSQDAAEIGKKLEGLRWKWIPYARSGRQLAERIVNAAKEAGFDLFVLANHGLIVAGDSFIRAESLLYEVEERLRLPYLTYATPSVTTLRARIDCEGWNPAGDRILHALASDLASFDLAVGRSLYPCHAVYLANRLGVFSDDLPLSRAIREHELRTGVKPIAFLAPCEGVVVSDAIDQNTKDQLHFLAEVIARLDPSRAVRTLSDAEAGQLRSDAAPALKARVTGAV